MLKWSCSQGEHKPIVFIESKNVYCKTCGSLLEEYAQKVYERLVSESDAEDDVYDTRRDAQLSLPFNGPPTEKE